MPSVFLTHSSKDKPFVRRLAGRLQEAGLVVWLDEADLKVGDSIIEKIGQAIKDVDFVVAVISSHSVASSWVQKEINLALTREIQGGKPLILPLLVDDCDVPDTLTDKLYADFRDQSAFDQQFGRLVQTMGISTLRQHLPNGIVIEWTDEGPRVTGFGTALSATESTTLLDRWKRWMKKYGKEELSVYTTEDGAVVTQSHAISVTRAFQETYGRVPNSEEEGTELADKLILFFGFSGALFDLFGVDGDNAEWK